jgi:ribosomal protein L37E
MERVTEHETCSKCGYDDVQMRYEPATPERRNLMPKLGGPPTWPARPARLAILCRRCGWLWERAPKDAADDEIASR